MTQILLDELQIKIIDLHNDYLNKGYGSLNFIVDKINLALSYYYLNDRFNAEKLYNESLELYEEYKE